MDQAVHAIAEVPLELAVMITILLLSRGKGTGLRRAGAAVKDVLLGLAEVIRVLLHGIARVIRALWGRK